MHTAFAQTDTITPFTAQYALKRGSMKLGEVRRELVKSGDGTYILNSHSKSTGLASMFVKDKIVEMSTWRLHKNRPRPISYAYHRTGGKRERHVELKFDWKTGTVTNDIGGDRWSMEVPNEALDKLLYQLVLMIDLRQPTDKITYDIADGGKLKEYQFDILGEETLETNLGELKTIKLERNRDHRITTIWCAKQYGYLPVKIKQNDEDQGPLHLEIESLSGIAIN